MTALLLENAIRDVPPHDQLIVAGDFNAVKGSDRSGFEQVVGHFDSGTLDDRGYHLEWIDSPGSSLCVLFSASRWLVHDFAAQMFNAGLESQMNAKHSSS